MSAAERLTISSLEDTVDIQGHLAFVEKLLSRHELDSARTAQWTTVLEKIRARCEDPNLYLAVVGEPSSGKSTLVNALIHRELLPADMIPAATSVVALVRYGELPRLVVEYNDGRSEQFADGVLSGELVKRFTSEEEARAVSRITVDCPAAMLNQGLVMVDLPETNTENAHHLESMGWEILDFCNAALVTVPADIPVSETLVELLRAQLGWSARRALFIVTKIDHVKPQDRPRLLEAVAGRLAAKLDLASPTVLPVSALAALGKSLPDGTDAASDNGPGEDYRALQEQFATTQERIARTLEAQRTVILLDHYAALLAKVFDHLADDLHILVESSLSAREDEKGEALRDLGPHIEDVRQRHGAALAARLDKAVAEARGVFAAVRQESLVRIHDLIAKARSGEGLRAAVSQSEVVLEVMEEQLASRLAGVSAQFGTATREEVATFASGLPALPQMPTAPAERSVQAEATARELARLVHGGLTGSAPAVAARIIADQRKQARLLIIATLIGFFLSFNPVIPLVPLFLLPVLVLLLSPGGEKRREAYWGLLRANVESSFARLGVAVDVRLAEARSEAGRQLEVVAGRYFAWYDEQIQSRTEADRVRAEEAARVERRLCGDLADLERRRKDLQQAREGLLHMQKR
jgi:GTP-binding protein EngB required for normal cell division